jgi:predicted nucleic acid-binding protein
MISKYVIDSYAWIEYFIGSDAGNKAKEYVEGSGALTPTIVIAELSDKYSREKQDFDDDLLFIKSRSQIIALDEEIAALAGRLNSLMKKEVGGWGMADSIVLATAKKHNANVITGDEHFRKVENSIMIR